MRIWDFCCLLLPPDFFSPPPPPAAMALLVAAAAGPTAALPLLLLRCWNSMTSLCLALKWSVRWQRLPLSPHNWHSRVLPRCWISSPSSMGSR